MSQVNNQYGSYNQPQQNDGYGYQDANSYNQSTGYYNGDQSQQGQVSTGYDSYNSYDPYSSQGGYDYSYDQNNSTGADSSYVDNTYYNKNQSQNNTSSLSKKQNNIIKIVLFLVPIVIAVFSIFGLLVEMGSINAPSIRPSKIFGTPGYDTNATVVEESDDYDKCVAAAGEITPGYPSMCVLNDVVYFKKYLISEKVESLQVAEKELAENGFILFAPTNSDSLSKIVETSNSTVNLPKYISGNVRSDMPYTMTINNTHLASPNNDNDILVDDVVSFIENGSGYDGEESSVVRAFDSRYQTKPSYILGEIDVDYPNADAVRAVYTIDNGIIQGRVFIKVFAQKRDNVVLLEKEMPYSMYTTQRSNHLIECAQQGLGPSEEQSCLLQKLGTDTAIKNEARSQVQSLVDKFTIGDIDFQIK